ncbi:MAG: hypothetical protein FVQ78_10775 [Solirubrobacterales bacterium]|nr:hypothetical protein [Solirubrobacterales bacterium]
MSAREKRSYEAARDALRGEGCRAGGYRLAAVDGDDYPLCCRHLAYAWRMFTAYPDDERIVIVVFDEHDRDHNPAAELAEVLPGLSTVGRRRSDKPACCENASKPPVMNDELRELLSALA